MSKDYTYFVNHENVLKLLSCYNIPANIPMIGVLQNFEMALVQNDAARCAAERGDFHNAWNHLVGQEHRKAKNSATAKTLLEALSKRVVHFGGPMDLPTKLLGKVKRFFVAEQEESMGDATYPVTEESIKLYNERYLLLRQPERLRLPHRLEGSYASIFESMARGNSPEEKMVNARESLIRIIRGEAFPTDYDIFSDMYTLSASNYINRDDPIDILRKIVFSPESVPVKKTKTEPPTTYNQLMSAYQLDNMNFLFRQISDPENAFFVFDGKDLDKYLEDYYNLNKQAVAAEIDFQTYLANLIEDHAAIEEYIESRYAPLKRILKGAGTRADYYDLQKFLDITNPLELLKRLVLPKSRIGMAVQTKKYSRSEQRDDPLLYDVAMDRMRLDFAKLSVNSTSADVVRNVQSDDSDIEMSEVDSIIEEILNVPDIHEEPAASNVFSPNTIKMRKVSNEDRITQLRSYMASKDERVVSKNTMIVSIFNSVMELYSLKSLSMMNLRFDTTKANFRACNIEAPSNDDLQHPIYLIASYIHLRIGNGSFDAENADTILLRYIYEDLLEVSKETIATNASINALNSILCYINCIIDSIVLEYDVDRLKPIVSNDIYVDQPRAIVELIGMLDVFQYNVKISEMDIDEFMKKVLSVYSIHNFSAPNTVSIDRTFAISTIRMLLKKESKIIFPLIPNYKQRERFVRLQRIFYEMQDKYYKKRENNTLIATIETKKTTIEKKLEDAQIAISEYFFRFSFYYVDIQYFFEACAEYEKYHSVQLYEDVVRRLKKKAETTMAVPHAKLIMISETVYAIINTYINYENHVRGLQILSWMDEYMDVTLANLAKSKELLLNEEIETRKKLASTKRNPAIVRRMLESGGEIVRRKLDIPSGDSLLLDYNNTSLDDVFNQLLEIMNKNIDMLPKGTDQDQVKRNAKFYLTFLMKFIAIISGKTIIDTNYSNYAKFFENIDYERVDVQFDAEHLAALSDYRRMADLLKYDLRAIRDERKARMVKAYIRILQYNFTTRLEMDVSALTYISGGKINHVEYIDYSLSNINIGGAGSVTEFVVEYESFIEEIRNIQTLFIVRKGRCAGEIYGILFLYIKYAESLLYKQLADNNSPPFSDDEISMHASEVDVEDALAILRGIYNRYNGPHHYLIDILQGILTAVKIFLSEHEFEIEPATVEVWNTGHIVYNVKILPHNVSQNFYDQYNQTSAIISTIQEEFNNVNDVILLYLKYAHTLAIHAQPFDNPVGNHATSDDIYNELVRIKNAYESNVEDGPFITGTLERITNTMKYFFINYFVRRSSERPLFIKHINTTLPMMVKEIEVSVTGSLTRMKLFIERSIQRYGKDVIRIIAAYLDYAYALFLFSIDYYDFDIQILKNMTTVNMEYLGAIPLSTSLMSMDEHTIRQKLDILNKAYEKNMPAGDRTSYNKRYAEIVYIIASKMESFIRDQYVPVTIQFGQPFEAKIVTFVDILQRIYPEDLSLILIHYAYAMQLGSIVHRLRRKKKIVLYRNDKLLLPNDLDAAAFVRYLLFTQAVDIEKLMIDMLAGISSALNRARSLEVHKYKNILATISTTNENNISKLRWITFDAILLPHEDFPPEIVVQFFSRCIFHLATNSPAAFDIFSRKERESIFYGMQLSS